MPCYAHPSCLTHFFVDSNLRPTALPFPRNNLCQSGAALGDRVLASWNRPGVFCVSGGLTPAAYARRLVQKSGTVASGPQT